jgi:uncharacterized hydrophobic protein (TIGR00271 family)
MRSVSDLRRSSRLTPGFLLLTALSSAIATFGLITDSAAVIIGAMLIAPLLSPIMGIALAVLGGRGHLLTRAALTLTVGIALALGLSFALAWLALQLPFGALTTIPHEVSSRTHPSPFDLAIALAGGAAAAYALVRLEGAAALFGVAIATALMPPLCTVGIGVALGDPGIWTAAGELFLTNLVAIAASATIVFAGLHLRPRRSRSGHSGLILVTGLVMALALVLIPTAVGVAQQRQATNQQLLFADTVSSTVNDVLGARLPGSSLVSVERSVHGSTLDLRVTAYVVDVPSLDAVRAMQTEVASRLGRDTHLVFVGIPAVELDPSSTLPPSPSPTPTPAPTPAPTATPTPTPSPTPSASPTLRLPATDT